MNPYILPGFIMSMVFCVVGGYWQALILMVAVAYVTDDTTFWTLLFVALVFLIVSFFRRAAGLDGKR